MSIRFPHSHTTDSVSSDAEITPCVLIDGVPLDWAGRGTSHVDFSPSERTPLTEGRFLGHGINGGVYETICQGHSLAWKKKFSRSKIGQRERKEIEIIKRLSHRHIIRLVGTYTQGPFLGLLLWPVATCDLASFMEDVDWLRRNYEDIRGALSTSPSGRIVCDENGEHATRLHTLKMWKWPLDATQTAVVRCLERSMGCIASAVAYLHQTGIKHKDLKPSNILLSHDGLWLTDFGTATDFSVLTQSATENGERGTPKYFAPEVAAYEPSGRSADIFSLGCIFLEMITLSNGYTLEQTKELRPKTDKSFHSNIESIIEWFRRERITTRQVTDEYFMGLIRRMLSTKPTARPTAEEVEEEIYLIDSFQSEFSSQFCGDCCNISRPPIDGVLPWVIRITIGNTYRQLGPNHHTYTFFVTPDTFTLGKVERVHFFMHESFSNNHKILIKPPFEYLGRGWGSFEIGVLVVLKPGLQWDHPSARPVPGQQPGNRMLPMIWELNFDNPLTSDTRTFRAWSDSSAS